jgi:hypothetical protein
MRKRDRIKAEVHNAAIRTMSTKQLSSPARLAIRAPLKTPLCACVGLCKHRVSGSGILAYIGTYPTQLKGGKWAYVAKYRIAFPTRKWDRTSVLYGQRPGVVKDAKIVAGTVVKK